MKTGTNLTACQSEFLRQFLLGASGFYLYPKEAQNVVLTSPFKSTKLVDKPIAGVTRKGIRTADFGVPATHSGRGNESLPAIPFPTTEFS